MIKENNKKLTLDRPAAYQIKVPGALNQHWVKMNGEISFMVENDEDGLPITTLTVTIDQAGLHGLLRRLYSLGLPLISVICV
jgi:hypothetical protein